MKDSKMTFDGVRAHHFIPVPAEPIHEQTMYQHSILGQRDLCKQWDQIKSYGLQLLSKQLDQY